MKCHDCGSGHLKLKAHHSPGSFEEAPYYQEWLECQACGARMSEEEALTNV